LVVRVVVVLALGVIGLVMLIIVAPILLVAALAFMWLAWKRPSTAQRVTTHRRLAPVPASVRSTPMRFASALVAGTFLLTMASVTIARPSEQTAAERPASADVTPAADEATDGTKRSPTQRATPKSTREPALRSTPSATPTREPRPVFGREPTGPVDVATVASVTDGDTIRVVLDGQNVPVRYIGIDTPETQNGVEWMGAEATAANAALVDGQRVVLEKDVSETDQYGRLLRYVWVEQDTGWLLVNLELLRQGFAQVTTYPPDVKYVDTLFVAAEREARDAGIGLWAAPPTAVPTPTTVQIVPLIPQPPSNCEASYPDFCIPAGSVDLDCGDIQWRRFTVRWDVPNPDPHRFDGDADGIGCES
jgi:micrococcal nuclease